MVTRTDGPFDYWEVTGDAVRAAAEAPGTNADVIQSLAGELEGDEKRAAAAIEGDITAGVTANTTAAKTAAQSLAAKGTYAVGLLNQFAADVDEFDKTVNQINLDYNNQVQTNISTARTEASQAAKDGEEPAAVDTGAIASAVKASFLPRYQKAEGIIDDAADVIASMFRQGPTDANVKELLLAGLIPFGAATLFPSVTLSTDEKQQALANTIKGMTPEQQAQYVKDHKDIDASLASVLSPEAQAILANDVAGDIKDRKIDGETVRFLDLFKQQPAFTTALYESVSPDEMADAIKYLNTMAFSSMGLSNSEMKPQLDLYDKFMNAAGVGLATYSRSTSDPHGLAEDYFKAITSDEPGDAHNGAALTLLMREGGEQQEGVFDAQFMDKLATDVLTWERENDDGDPVWSSRTTEIMDPDAHEQNGQYFGRTASDGLANLLGAMGHSPDAAQAFFQDDTGKIDSGILDYLIGQKDGDDVDGRTFSGMNISDEGDGLGEAMEAAALGGDPRFAAEFTTDVFSRIADLSGHDPSGGHDTGWHVWEDMTDSLGSMASGYTGDIYELMRNSAPDSDPGLDLTPDQMAKVLGEIGSSDNKDGLTLLTSAMMMELNNQTDTFLDGLKGPHTLDALAGSGFTGLQTDHGTVMGNLLNNGLSVSVSNDELAKKQQEIMSRALDIATGFVPGAGKILGEGASDLGKMAFDTLKGQAIQELKAGLQATPDTDGYLDQATGDINTKIKYSALNVLYNNGYLGPQTLEDHKEPFPGVSTDMLIGDPPRIRPDLYDQDGYEINTDKMSPEDKAQAEKAEAAWNDFTDSSAHEVLTDLAYQSAFLESFVNPEVRVGK